MASSVLLEIWGMRNCCCVTVQVNLIITQNGAKSSVYKRLQGFYLKSLVFSSWRDTLRDTLSWIIIAGAATEQRGTEPDSVEQLQTCRSWNNGSPDPLDCRHKNIRTRIIPRPLTSCFASGSHSLSGQVYIHTKLENTSLSVHIIPCPDLLFSKSSFHYIHAYRLLHTYWAKRKKPGDYGMLLTELHAWYLWSR